MKFVHAADIHLDSPLHGLARYPGAPVDEIRAATRRAFENLVALCADEQVAFLVLAGDLYDGDWRDFGTGLFFAAQMARLREHGVRVFVVRGNHDAASRITKSLRLPDNVHTFGSRRPETQLLEDLGVALHGQSFARGDVTENLAADYPPPLAGLVNIGVLHTSADGRPGHANYAPCRVPDLVARGYDYWALGHVHAREVLHEDPWVVFPGNLQGRHARETGAKGCTVVTVEHGRIRAVEARSLDVVRWLVVEVDATGCATPVDALERLAGGIRAALAPAEGRVCALRVRVSGRCAAHAALLNRREGWVADARALATDLGAGLAWVEKVILDTAPAVDWHELTQQGGPIAELVRDIESLRADDARLGALGATFEDLKSKLPTELREGDGALTFAPAQLRALLGDAASLLLPRLLGADDDT